MNLMWRFVCLILVYWWSTYPIASVAAETSTAPVIASHIIPGELLVKYKSETARYKVRTRALKYKPQVKAFLPGLGVEHWKISAGQSTAELIQQLKKDPSVLVVEPNIRRYPRTSHALTANQQERFNQLNLLNLWNIPKTGNRQIKIAVIDDAFEINHIDLNAAIVSPFDAVDNDTDPSPEPCRDESGQIIVDNGQEVYETHGTRVIGVVGAVKDDHGLEGASDNATIVPIRIGCDYSLAAELNALEYAKQQGVDIISISWGGPQYSELERLGVVDLLKENILLVTAAGNFGMDNDRVLDYPSGLGLPNILAVAATDTSNRLVNWSHFGQTSVDLAAPGVNFDTISPLSGTVAYRVDSGTSFSAPIVAGVAASLMARNDNADIFDIKAALMGSAKPMINTPKARTATDGYIDALAAYNFLQAPAPVPVISDILIDDTSGGNANGEIDARESPRLIVKLQNIGAPANYMQAILRLVDTDSLVDVVNFSDNLNFDNANFDFPVKELVFYPDLQMLRQEQDIKFSLEISGSYGVNSPFSVTRYFTVDGGSLDENVDVTAQIRKSGDEQDKFHYYHFVLEKSAKALSVNLTAPNVNQVSNHLDLLVKKGTTPKFDYKTYWSDEVDAVDPGTKVSASRSSSNESITIENPTVGTYHIVVVATEHNTQPDIDYQIRVETGGSKAVTRAAGCTLGVGAPFDPMLWLLSLVALWRLRRMH